MGIMRVSRNGELVSDKAWLWRNDDCEIATTLYAHPSITSGQHTNGKYSVWIRSIGGDWIKSKENHLHHTVQAWKMFGIEWFEGEKAVSKRWQ